MKRDIGWKDNNDGQGAEYERATGPKDGKQTWRWNCSDKTLTDPDGEIVAIENVPRRFVSARQCKFWILRKGSVPFRLVEIHE